MLSDFSDTHAKREGIKQEYKIQEQCLQSSREKVPKKILENNQADYTESKNTQNSQQRMIQGRSGIWERVELEYIQVMKSWWSGVWSVSDRWNGEAVCDTHTSTPYNPAIWC